jgi:hypothetical protein
MPGKDPALPVPGSTPSDEPDFFEVDRHVTPEKRESPRSEKRSEFTPIRTDDAPAEKPGSRRDAISRVDRVVTRPTSRRQDSLSNEPPFTVHLPKTLRPVADNKIEAAVETEQPRSTAPPIHTNDVVPEASNVEEPSTIVQRSSDSIVAQPATPAVEQAEVRTTKEAVGARDEFRRAPVKPTVKDGAVQPVAPEPAPSAPDERFIQVPEQPAQSVQPVAQRAEPVPAAALPVQLPPPAISGSQRKQEQSRVHIGSLEVTVNNHPPVTPARTARPTSLQTDHVNLERRYLDRFRLKR